MVFPFSKEKESNETFFGEDLGHYLKRTESPGGLCSFLRISAAERNLHFQQVLR